MRVGTCVVLRGWFGGVVIGAVVGASEVVVWEVVAGGLPVRVCTYVVLRGWIGGVVIGAVVGASEVVV